MKRSRSCAAVGESKKETTKVQPFLFVSGVYGEDPMGKHVDLSISLYLPEASLRDAAALAREGAMEGTLER